jgi:predicted negative regulator of RcsB-dependent stress response
MSDDFDSGAEPTFSPFYPLLILICGLLIWFGYQDYASNAMRSAGSRQFQAALPTITQAQAMQNRYVALMKDLAQTASKDPAAAQIVNDAVKAGWIRVQNNPAPASADTSTTSAPAK